MTKKFISVLLTLALALSQIGVFAEESEPIISNPVEERIVRTEATFVRGGSYADSHEGNGLSDWELQVDAGSGARRVTFVKFDLTSYASAFLSDEVVSLKFGLTPNAATDSNFTVSILSDANEQYVDTNLTYNIASSHNMIDGNTLLYTSESSILSDATKAYYTDDIKSAIRSHLEENTANKIVVFAVDTTDSAAYSIKDKTSGSAYAPHLMIKSGINITNRLSEIKLDITWDKIKGINTSKDAITSNLSLIRTGLYDTEITWSTDLPYIDTLNGTVTRPAMYEGDATGTLTAEFGIEADGTLYSDSVSFDITVLESDLLPQEFIDPAICLADNAGFVRINESNGTGQIVVDSGQGANRIGFASFDLTEHIATISQAESIEFRITTNHGRNIDANWAVCVLPESMENKHIGSFTYAEAKTDGLLDYTTGAYVSARGLENNKAYYSQDIKSAVIESMQNDAKLLIKLYSTDGEGYTLWGTDGSDSVKPALIINYPKPTYEQDMLLLSVPSITDGDIVLPTNGVNGSSISWNSSDESTISTSGVVTVDVYDEDLTKDDKIVTLTANVTDGSNSTTRSFDVRVKRTGVVDALYDTYISDSANNSGVSVIPLGGTNTDVALIAFNMTADEKNYITNNDSRSIILELYSQNSYAQGKTVKVTPIDIKPDFDDLEGLSYTDATNLESASNTYEYKGAFKNGKAYIDVSEYVRGLSDGYALFALKSDDTGFDIDTLESKLGHEPKLLISSTALTDEYALQKATEALNAKDIIAATDTSDEVRRDLSLPSDGRYNSTITWTAQPGGVVNTLTGEVTRPSENTVVILTATFEVNGETTRKDYTFTVVKAESDLEFANYLLNKLSVQNILTKGITLPGADFVSEGATVSWISSNSSATSITDDYKLSVNRSLNEDITCTLTATLGYNSETVTKDFEITLLRTGEKNILKNKTISSGDLSAFYAIDDNIDTYWNMSNTELVIDLNNAKAALNFTIIPYENDISSVSILMSRDGISYEDVASFSKLKANKPNYINLLSPGFYGRYVKFNFSGGKISELAAYATGESASSGDVFASVSVPTSVTGDFTLPALADGNAITWTSNSNNFTISGTNVSVTITSSKYNATVTASVTVNGETKTKNYTVYVDKAISTPGGNTLGSGSGLSGGSASGTGGSAGGNTSVITPALQTSFNDLDSVPWAKEYIEYLYKNGIINGKGDGRFAPNDNLLREEYAKIISLAFDIPIDSASQNEFVDVADNSWYEDYVNAIANAGITLGIGNGNFGVGFEINRQDVMVMIARILKITPSDDYVLAFADSDKIADYAYSAVCALSELGIISGDNLGNVNPTGSITRAEMAKIVYLAMNR